MALFILTALGASVAGGLAVMDHRAFWFAGWMVVCIGLALVAMIEVA